MAATSTVVETSAEATSLLVPSRNANYERLRVLAVVGILAFHTQSGLLEDIGYAGLPMFILIMAIVNMRRPPPATASFARKKVTRLLLPWAGWVLIYLAADLAAAVYSGESPLEVLASLNPVYGTRLLLWYMPFAFLGLVGVNLLQRRLREPGVGVVALLTAGATVCSLPQATQPDLPSPLGQFLFGAPGLLFGMAMGFSAWLPGRKRVAGLVLPVAGGLAAAGAIALMDRSRAEIYLLSYCLALVLVGAATLWPGRRLDGATRFLAPLTLGIYLGHPLASMLLYRIPGYDPALLLHGVVGLFFATVLVTRIFRLAPGLRRLV